MVRNIYSLCWRICWSVARCRHAHASRSLAQIAFLFSFRADSLRRRAWPKLVGLHQRTWKDPASAAAVGKKKRSLSAPTIPPEMEHSSRGVVTRSMSSKETLSQVVEHDVNQTATVPTGALPRRPPRPEPLHHYRSTSNSSLTVHTNDNASISSSTHSVRDMVLASSLDWAQIDLDAARCTWHLLTGAQRAQRDQVQHQQRLRRVARAIRRKQRRLANLINLTLVLSYKECHANSSRVEKDNTLRYYQGYHDVACIILSTLGGCRPIRVAPGILSSSHNTLEGMAVATGLELPAAVLLQLSRSHFRDCMRANFAQLQTALRLTMLPLLAYFDPEVHAFLQQVEMEPFFALSWVITWFSHDIRDTELVKRLFDFFLVSHPLMPIYVAVAMVSHPLNRQDVLQSSEDGVDDFASVHHALSSLPRNSSMMGWKYSPGGDGYVSDDGEDDLDDDEDFDESSSVGYMDSQSSVDTEFLRQESSSAGADMVGGVEAISIVSSSVSSMLTARVPFQELIDTAIHYMDRMPPKSLICLATRYYGRTIVKDMIVRSPTSISLFEPPPAWTRASKAKSVLRVKLPRRRSDGSMLVRNRSTGSVKSADGAITTGSIYRERVDETDDDDDDNSPSESGETEFEDYLDTNVVKRLWREDRSKAMAAIAAGLSTGDDAERRRKKHRKRMMLGAAAVLVVAVVIGVMWKSRSRQSKSVESGRSGSNTLMDVGGREVVPDTCASSGSDSMVVMATSPPLSIDRSSRNMGGSTAMAEKYNTMRGGLLPVLVQPKVPPTVHQVSLPSLPRVTTELVTPEISIQAVANVPQVDVLLSVLAKMVFRETLMLGDHLQHVGTSVFAPKLKALASKSKDVVKATRHALAVKPRPGKSTIIPKVALPDLTFAISMLRDGIDRGASLVKHNMHELHQAVLQKAWQCVQELQSAVSLAASDPEYAQTLATDECLYALSTSNTHFLMLDQEFHLSHVTKAVSHTVGNVMRNLGPALHKLQAKIVLDMKGSLHRVVQSQTTKDIIRGASMADLYTLSKARSPELHSPLDTVALPERHEHAGINLAAQSFQLDSLPSIQDHSATSNEPECNEPTVPQIRFEPQRRDICEEA
jgi:Rab-GTPase-TBC domain